MREPLNLRRMCIMPTLKCTLRCKLCSNYMTMFQNPEHVPVNEIIRDVDRIFEIIDYTEWLQFVGGELFMRRDLWELYEHCLKYKDRFDKLILVVNATLMPCEKDVETFKKYGTNIQVQISDYGAHSPKTAAMVELFDEHSIPYIVKCYHGNMQHYGGWVDNTHFTDRGKSDEDVVEQHKNCGQVSMRNYHMYRGKLHGCARSLMASTLGKIVPAERDVVDIYDAAETDSEKREKIRRFNDLPRASCKSCISFSENAPRFPAAEQI